MKTKVRNWFNVFLGAVLGLMGFGCFSCGMYGVPTYNLTVEGEVTDENEKPLPKMQVINRKGSEGYWLEDYADTLYTNTKGKYYKKKIEELRDPLKVIIGTIGVQGAAVQAAGEALQKFERM